MLYESFSFRGPANLNLVGRAWTTSKAIKSFVGIHGYSEHGKSYEHFAQFLNSHSYNVFFLDLPGHGESSGRRSDISDFSIYTEAVSLFLGALQERFDVKNYSLFGHSLGGLIAIRYIQEKQNEQLQSLTLSSPLLGLSDRAFHGLGYFLQSDVAMSIFGRILGLLPNFTLSNQHDLGSSILTHDIEMQEKRKQDPLIHPIVTVGWTREFLKARKKAFKSVSKVKIPTGFFLSGKDLVVSQRASEAFYSMMISEKKLLKIYSNSFHEILNETNRDEVMVDILDWIERYARHEK